MKGEVKAVLFYLFSVVTGVTDINIDLGCYSTTSPDMAFDSSIDLEDTMAPD